MWRRRRRGSSISTKSTRSPASPIPRRSPAMFPAKGCSRPCSRSSKERWPVCRPRGAASIRSRNSSRSTPPISSSSAAAPFPAWKHRQPADRRQDDGLRRRCQAATRSSQLGEASGPGRTGRSAASYGLIPEFVGRLPVVATLDELDEEALVQILKEPKNALVKQYQKLFDMEQVNLKFTDGALVAVARRRSNAKPGPAACVRSWKTPCSMSCMRSRPRIGSRKS